VRLTVFALSIVFSMSAAAVSLEGTLQTADRAPLVLSDRWEQTASFSNGPIKVEVERTGFIGLVSSFTGARYLNLTQGNQSVSLDLTTDDFRSFGDFRTPVSFDKKVVLAGTSTVQILRVFQREKLEACTFAGWCQLCTAVVVSDGQTGMDCGYKFGNCSGTEVHLNEVTEYVETSTVSVQDAAAGTVLALIHGDPQKKERSRYLHQVRHCM
jgi:hypothetical protein